MDQLGQKKSNFPLVLLICKLLSGLSNSFSVNLLEQLQTTLLIYVWY